jgi:diguanylate cyclase (GGDEF)-like protein
LESINVPQVALMAAEIILVSVLFLACFRLRAVLGLAPVYTALGVVFYTCGFLAASVYIQVAPGFVVSPGTVSFFPAILFVVLCVYITEDAGEARKLIYALLISDVFVAALGWLTALHLRLGSINAYHLSPDLFSSSPRVSTVSVIALFADTIFIILLYEFISRYTSSLFWRIYLSTAAALIFDTFVFITGAYIDSPQFFTILVSAMLGKVLAAIPYAILFAIYLRYFDLVEPAMPADARALGPMFRTLTYRQKYELLQARSVRDPLTGIYNRGFFDEILAVQAATSSRAQTPFALLMADVDNFKRINDSRGHVEGDRVLQAVAACLAASCRAADYVCRYGGEEFAIILPNTNLENAANLAEKARILIAELGDTAGLDATVTITIGVAVFPDEATSPQELLQTADRRLYEGKNGGRNCVVAGAAEIQI